MKNLKKVLAVMTAVASLCMSATAFAATGTVSSEKSLTGEFNWDTSTLTINNGNAVKADSETTILVLDKDANDTNVAEQDILYINQKNTSEGTNFAGMGLKLTDIQNLADGDYIIKVGYYPTEGNFTIADAILTVSSGTTPGEKTITIKLGDFNGDGRLTGSDLMYSLRASVGKLDACTLKDVTDTSKIVNAAMGDELVIKGVTVKLGDFNGDGRLTGSDLMYSLRASVGKLDACTLKDVTDTSKVVNATMGDEVPVKVPEVVTE